MTDRKKNPLRGATRTRVKKGKEERGGRKGGRELSQVGWWIEWMF